MENLPRGKYYVTVSGERRLREEFERLEIRRGEMTAHIRTAKSYGDLSENFEYHEARREAGMVEGRLQQLRIIIPSLHVVNPEQVETDRVGFGSCVTVRDESGEEWSLLVVGPLEADPVEDRVSYESPLGSALVGSTVGAVVEAEVPAGRIRYEILHIRAYDPYDL